MSISLQKRAQFAAILGGLFWIAFHLYYIYSGVDYLEITSSILLIALGVFCMTLAVLFLMGGLRLGAAGKTGAGILLVGMTLVVLGAGLVGLNLGGGFWLLVIGGESLTVFGLIAFSIGALAEAPRPPWKWLSLILAPVYFVSFSTTSDSFPAWAPAYTPEWFGALYGVGWIILGLLLPGNEARR